MSRPVDARRPAEEVDCPMTQGEMQALLSRNHVGRIVYAWGDRVDVESVHYAYEGGWIYGRARRKACPPLSIAGWWPMGFEVDEVSESLEIRSVVVHGRFHPLSAVACRFDLADREKAVAILRRAMPPAFRAEDPGAEHDLVFKICVQEMTGHTDAASSTE